MSQYITLHGKCGNYRDTGVFKKICYSTRFTNILKSDDLPQVTLFSCSFLRSHFFCAVFETKKLNQVSISIFLIICCSLFLSLTISLSLYIYIIYISYISLALSIQYSKPANTNTNGYCVPKNRFSRFLMYKYK